MRSSTTGAFADHRAVVDGASPSAVPNAEADVERVLAIGFIAIRAGIIVALALAVAGGYRSALNPLGYVLLAGLVTVVSVAFCADSWRRRRISARPWGVVDISLAFAAFVALAPMLPPEAWATPQWYAVSFAINAVGAMGAWLRDLRSVTVVTVLMMALSMAVAVYEGREGLANLLAYAAPYPMFSFSIFAITTYLRAMAAETDSLRAQAVSAARRAELDRYRLMVHDISGILRLLGDETTPKAMLAPLRQQALQESARLRTYLSDHPTPSTAEEGTTLSAIIHRAVAGFGDLPLELSIDLGAQVALNEADALALQRAIVTTLHNVRRHSGATQVVIHADSEPPRWELVIRDDGKGFDPKRTRLGFGLGVQVVEELQKRGLSVEVVSARERVPLSSSAGPKAHDRTRQAPANSGGRRRQPGRSAGTAAHGAGHRLRRGIPGHRDAAC